MSNLIDSIGPRRGKQIAARMNLCLLAVLSSVQVLLADPAAARTTVPVPRERLSLNSDWRFQKSGAKR